MINILLHCFAFTVSFCGVFCLLTSIQLVFCLVLDKTDSKYCQKLIQVTNFITYFSFALIIIELLALAVITSIS